jgi:hypothetical protein
MLSACGLALRHWLERTPLPAAGPPTDLVVWVNLTSKIYHFAGHKSYGTTKAGAYMCEKEATAHGFRASKTEKGPSAGS